MKEDILRNFVEFYLESFFEDPDEDVILTELHEAGVNSTASKRKALTLLHKARAEAKLAQGKEFKKNYTALLENLTSHIPEIGTHTQGLALAFRKLDTGSGGEEPHVPDRDDIQDDIKKLKLLELLKDKTQ
jgi:hypothetical protein